MNEIERAIKVLEEEYAFSLECDATQKRSSAYKTALTALRAELSSQENAPLTWNERINQMTVEEKVEWLNCTEFCRVTDIPIEECNSYNDCKECMRAFLNSPYTEGETK